MTITRRSAARAVGIKPRKTIASICSGAAVPGRPSISSMAGIRAVLPITSVIADRTIASTGGQRRVMMLEIA